MVPLVLGELLPFTKAVRTDIDAISGFAYWVCTLDSNGVCQVAVASITLDLQARLVHGWINT